MDIDYLALVVLININIVIGGGVVHSLKSWSNFKRTHAETISSTVDKLRDDSILSMTVGLIDYIDEERKSNPQARVTNLLAYGYSDEQLRVIEPILRAREDIGENRSQLQSISNSAVTFSKVSAVSLAVAFVSLFLVFVPLGLNVDFSSLTGAWYASAASIVGLSGATDVASMLAVHIVDTKFSTRVSKLGTGDNGSVS